MRVGSWGMSDLQDIADRLLALAQDASPLSTNLEAAVQELQAITGEVEALCRSGYDTGPLLAVLKQAQNHARNAVGAAAEVKANGVDWANHLAIRSNGSSSGDAGAPPAHTAEHAANSPRSFGKFSATDIRVAAAAPDRNGLTRSGRALQKHSEREGSVFRGLSSGTADARNGQGMKVVDEILNDVQGWTEVLDKVTNIWDSAGRGVRISNEGAFMGFLEPLP
jgi:hypothetical protein